MSRTNLIERKEQTKKQTFLKIKKTIKMKLKLKTIFFFLFFNKFSLIITICDYYSWFIHFWRSFNVKIVFKLVVK